MAGCLCNFSLAEEKIRNFGQNITAIGQPELLSSAQLMTRRNSNTRIRPVASRKCILALGDFFWKALSVPQILVLLMVLQVLCINDEQTMIVRWAGLQSIGKLSNSFLILCLSSYWQSAFPFAIVWVYSNKGRNLFNYASYCSCSISVPTCNNICPFQWYSAMSYIFLKQIILALECFFWGVITSSVNAHIHPLKRKCHVAWPAMLNKGFWALSVPKLDIVLKKYVSCCMKGLYFKIRVFCD